MLQGDKILNCQLHPSSELSVIHLGENPSIKSKPFCIECVQNIKKIFKFFVNPGMQCRKSISDDIDVCMQYVDKCLEQIVGFLKKFQESIQIHLEQLKQNVKSLKTISSTINYEIEKQSNFKELRKLFQTFKKMNSFQETQEFKKIYEGVNSFGQNFPKFYNNAVNAIKARKEQSLKDYKQSLINIQKDLSQMSSINIFAKFQINVFNWENQNDFSFVLQNLTQGNLKYDLLYQGSRDGLSTQKYWVKCDKQINLLTIITLKNGNIFGGYSPCKVLKRDVSTYSYDDTKSSFIFQQNKQEIYKLKDMKYESFAVCCHKDHGPSFGDFHVENDFQSLNSQIGGFYDITGYNVLNKNTHLIGDKDTEIIECKVYKITYFL